MYIYEPDIVLMIDDLGFICRRIINTISSSSMRKGNTLHYGLQKEISVPTVGEGGQQVHIFQHSNSFTIINNILSSLTWCLDY